MANLTAPETLMQAAQSPCSAFAIMETHIKKKGGRFIYVRVPTMNSRGPARHFPCRPLSLIRDCPHTVGRPAAWGMTPRSRARAAPRRRSCTRGPPTPGSPARAWGDDDALRVSRGGRYLSGEHMPVQYAVGREVHGAARGRGPLAPPPAPAPTRNQQPWRAPGHLRELGARVEAREQVGHARGDLGRARALRSPCKGDSRYTPSVGSHAKKEWEVGRNPNKIRNRQRRKGAPLS
jgi:hypothetical protein